LSAFSAHADSNEIIRWLGGFRSAPRRTFIVHGRTGRIGCSPQPDQQRTWLGLRDPAYGREFRTCGGLGGSHARRLL